MSAMAPTEKRAKPLTSTGGVVLVVLVLVLTVLFYMYTCPQSSCKVFTGFPTYIIQTVSQAALCLVGSLLLWEWKCVVVWLQRNMSTQDCTG